MTKELLAVVVVLVCVRDKDINWLDHAPGLPTDVPGTVSALRETSTSCWRKFVETASCCQLDAALSFGCARFVCCQQRSPDGG